MKLQYVVALKDLKYHFDMSSGERKARATFASNDEILTTEGMKPSIVIELPADGAQAEEFNRVKVFTVTLCESFIPVVNTTPEPEPDLVESDPNADVVVTTSPVEIVVETKPVKAKGKPTGK